MSVGLEVSPFLESRYDLAVQYPSPALTLLTLSEEKGADAMFEEIEKRVREKTISVDDLNDAAYFFTYYGDWKIATKLLEFIIAWSPGTPFAYGVLGGLHLDDDNYEAALKYLTKAKALRFNFWDIEDDLEVCVKGQLEVERRKAQLVKVERDKETLIEAENYNAMSGCKLQRTSDTSGVSHVGSIDTGDWLHYNVDVPVGGGYWVDFRINSLKGGGRVELRSGSNVLAATDIGATHGSANWATVGTTVYLPPGNQTLALHAAAGGFTINWIRLTPVPASANK
jgi:tetratricopeptide (TPR) repeat protein